MAHAMINENSLSNFDCEKIQIEKEKKILAQHRQQLQKEKRKIESKKKELKRKAESSESTSTTDDETGFNKIFIPPPKKSKDNPTKKEPLIMKFRIPQGNTSKEDDDEKEDIEEDKEEKPEEDKEEEEEETEINLKKNETLIKLNKRIDKIEEENKKKRQNTNTNTNSKYAFITFKNQWMPEIRSGFQEIKEILKDQKKHKKKRKNNVHIYI